MLSSLNRTIASSWSMDGLFNPSHPRSWPLVLFLGGLIPALALKPGLYPRSRFWAVVFLVFWVGTLGPFLKWGGTLDSAQVVTLADRFVLRLPWTGMFRWIPGMSRMFAPYRMGSLAVVAAVHLDDLVAAGVAPRQPKRAHCGLRARVHQADHAAVEAWDHRADQLRELDFSGRRSAETQTVPNRFLYGIDDLGVRMSQEGRTPGSHVVDERDTVLGDDAVSYTHLTLPTTPYV